MRYGKHKARPMPEIEPGWCRRFHLNYIKDGANCWQWTGYKNSQGYGRIYIGRVSFPAHRIAWHLANNYAEPGDHLVCHSCDNPGCVNPDHLFLGTDSDNVKDMVDKSRHPAMTKTHCKKGHKLDGLSFDNRRKKKVRYCRQCRNGKRKALAEYAAMEGEK